MSYVKARDLETYYLEKGAGTPVVLIHGNWATSSWWEPTLARLPAGRRAFAPDLRGRGKTRGRAADNAIPTLAADMLAFADAVGVRRFDVVGHSLGSAVAIELALSHPERLRSLVVVTPAWIDGMPASYAVPEHQQRLKDDPAYLNAALHAIVPVAEDDFWKRLVREGGEQHIDAAMALIPALMEWKPGDAVGRIDVPRVVIVGANDLFTGGPNAVRVAQALGCELISMPGVAHGPMVEAPDEFARILFEHLSPVERATA
ncbi:MAG TPA: alpha/beta hydrolase [Candidatus Limnocylindria bacterium]